MFNHKFGRSSILPTSPVYCELRTGYNNTGIQSLLGVGDPTKNIDWTTNINDWLIVGLVSQSDRIDIKGKGYNTQTPIAFLNNDTDNKTGSIVSIAYDPNNNKVHFAVNGKWIDTDLSEDSSGIGTGFDVPVGWTIVADSVSCTKKETEINFGQYPFVYTPPSGYEGLYESSISSVRNINTQSTERRYLAFKDNTLEVTGLLEENSIPNPVNIGSPPDGSTPTTYTLTFPDVFSSDEGNGQEPDLALLKGTGIVVEGTGIDGGTTYSSTSNMVIPQDPPPIPPVTMNGLRFDGDRDTHLKRTGTTPTPTFTVSFWIKRTDSNNSRVFKIEGAKDNNKLLCVWSFGDGSLRINDNSTTRLQVNNALPANKWVHIVVNRTTTEINAYVNGAKSTAAYTQTFDAGSYSYNIGGFGDSGASDLNGYMSDVYFVEGSALEGTTFGIGDSGTWGPLGSDVVKTNIANSGGSAPFDTRPNMDQEWSTAAYTSGTVNPTYPLTNLFNGTTGSGGNNSCYAGGPTYPSTVQLDFTSLPANAPVVVHGYGALATSGILSINGVDVSADLNFAGLDFDISDNVRADGTLTIAFTANNGGVDDFAALTYIEVDGQMLVDGPANNDQVWSSSGATASNGTYDGTPADVFDGDESTSWYVSGGPNPGATGTIPFSGIDVDSKVRILFYPRQGTVPLSVTINGTTETKNITGNSVQWVEFLGSGPLSSISATTTDTYMGFHVIEVDDKLLIDGGAQWNTSQVWSDGAGPAGAFQQSASLAFDGDTSTNALFGVNNTVAFDLLGITSVTKVEILTEGSAQECPVLLNGSSSGVTIAAGQSKGWVSIYDGSAITLNSVGFTVGGASQSLYAIRVNNEILVDPGSFGSNGFYLPFDPAATGKNYSANTSGTVSYSNPQNAFDGSLSTQCAGPNPKGKPGEFTFNFNPPLSGKIEVYGSSGSNTAQAGDQILLSDGSVWDLQNVGLSSKKWHDFGTKSNITSITLKTTSTNNSAGVDLSAVRVDGEILIDEHTYVGTDDSGKNNHFRPENFAVGNTSQVWSDGGSANFTPGNMEEGWKGMFDGDESTRLYVNTSSDAEVFTVTFSPALTSVTSLTQICSGSNTSKITANGNTTVVVPSASAWGSRKEQNILSTLEGSTTLSSLSFTAGVNDASFGSIKVNGVPLIDANAQDTVTDTPIKDYAVLEGSGGNITISNGNLVSTNGASGSGHSNARSTQSMSAGKYYFEGIPTAKSDFGDNMIGVVQSTFGNNWVGSAGSVSYDCTRGWKYVDGTATDKTLPLASFGDIVGVALDVDARTIDFYLNGTLVYSETAPAGDLNFAVGHSQTANIVNFGQQPFAASNVTHNMTTGVVTIGVDEYSTLVEAYANSARHRSVRPSTSNIDDWYNFAAIEPAFDQYDVDKDTRMSTITTAKQSARTKLIALGLTDDEVTSLALQS